MNDLNLRRLSEQQAEPGQNLLGETEKGILERYELFPGIHLYRMDLYTDTLDVSGMADDEAERLITISHCHRGRFEGELASGEFFYLGEGDMAVNLPERAVLRKNFPLSRFQGIRIVLEIDRAAAGMKQLETAFGRIPIDFRQLRCRLLADGPLGIFRNTGELSRVFEEIYEEREADKEFYFRVKVLELLYDLSAGKTWQAVAVRCFEKNQVLAVKKIRSFLVAHLDTKFTLEELSHRFSLPLTSLKECFKAVYGLPVNGYMREYRMNVAAGLLRETDLSVAEIAGQVGYLNQSKFAEVFRQQMQRTPVEYRNQS